MEMRPVCWQREMRDREAEEKPRQQDDRIDYKIEPIGKEEAKEFILRYEWLGTTGRAVAKYGARNKSGELVAAALFGWPSSPESRDICGKEYRDKAVCLERGACAHFAHPHTASWFIPKAVSAAHTDFGWSIFYAYSDQSAGEIGTVYQACNWIYIGQGVGRTPGRPREDFRDPGGRVVSSRWLRHNGLKKRDVLNQGWEVVLRPPKHKYVWLEGSKTERKQLLKALRYPALPYPKRPSPVPGTGGEP